MMRVRIPIPRRRGVSTPPPFEPPGAGGEPPPAFRILTEPPDPPDWHVVDPCESVRVLQSRNRPEPAPATFEAGYRWGSVVARAGAPSEDPRLPAVRVERALVSLAVRTDVLASAVERIEDRLEHLADSLFDAATQSDLIEVEARRARLAAEVSRLAVELRAEIDRRLSEVGRTLAERDRRSVTVDHPGPLDLADARRAEVLSA